MAFNLDSKIGIIGSGAMGTGIAQVAASTGHKVMLINEAADAVFMNVAAKDDIELAMTKGVNYPKGLLHWADEIGIDKVANKLNSLYDFYKEDRYRVNPLLQRMIVKDEKFYG